MFNVNGTHDFYFRDGYRVPATHFYYREYDTFGSILNRFKKQHRHLPTASVDVILYIDDRNDSASVKCILRTFSGAFSPHALMIQREFEPRILWLKLSLLVVFVYQSLLSCQVPLILSTKRTSPFNLGSNYRPTFREQCVTFTNVNDLCCQSNKLIYSGETEIIDVIGR